MTQSNPTHSNLAPGDVLDYLPRHSHCRERTAIVQDNGRAADTYWTYDPTILSADELATATLRFRLADYREVGSKDEWMTYAPTDRESISAQHGYQWTYYVRVGSEPDLATQIENAREAVAKAESDLRTAEWRLAIRREELAELEARDG